MFEFGIIVAVEPRRARVKFPDLKNPDGKPIEMWLRVGESLTKGDLTSIPHAVGTRVGCGLKEGFTDGLVLAAYFADGDKVATENLDKILIKTESGTEVEIDKKSGTVLISGKAPITIKSDTGLTLETSAIGEATAGFWMIKGTVLIQDTMKHVHVCATPGSASSPPIVPFL